jgi:hypothetical protein
MEPEKISRDILKLPPEAQRQVMDLIAFLSRRYKKNALKSPYNIQKLSSESFIGIWKDRNELSDGDSWLREIRKTEWREPRG